MKIEYDRKADALYVHLKEEPHEIQESREVEPGVILDLNAKKELQGIEVLDVSRRFKEAELFEFAVKEIG
ncbi:DUF2283 domain-containing protein [Candidatus Uhrbacteria bacterium]|nr:DUF2283 domain-containing protein [Candidatus Uhrbacteria bacterium]